MLLFHSQNVPVENKNLVKNELRWKAIVGKGGLLDIRKLLT